MSTDALFAEDPYRRECEATVQAVEGRHVVLDRTVFYPVGGGQPGDTGVFLTAGGLRFEVVDTRRLDGELVHVIADDHLLEDGLSLRAVVDWERRYAHMRMHTCLHLLGALIPAGVTGGNISAIKSRLDFDTDEALDKEALTVALNRLIAEDHRVSRGWITQEELRAQPELVRTMSVKPPSDAPLVRLLEVEGVDLQPCGGTHVARTGEIGPVHVSKIESKGRRNKRVHVVFAPELGARCGGSSA